MSSRIIFLFFTLLIYIPQSFSQGLHFKGNNFLIDDRSSYNVFEEMTPTFKKTLTIDFSIIIEVLSNRGNIVRIKDDEIGAVYNISYSGEGNKPIFMLNHEGRSSLITIAVDDEVIADNQWVKVHLEFDMQKNSVMLRINERELSTKLELNKDSWKPNIYFGRSEHIIDVPTFKLCDLMISDCEKTYHFPLNESEGSSVHDSHQKVVGHVVNPWWLINDSYYWKEGASFSSKKVAGTNFNSHTQDVYFFNEDTIHIYNTRTNYKSSYQYANKCPMPMRLGTNFLDLKNNRLYIYEVADPPHGNIVVAYLDLNSLHWTAVTSEVLPAQMHHHSNYMDAKREQYIIFGGFGNVSYFNSFHAFDLPSGHWKKLTFEGDVITPRYFTSMGYNQSDNGLYVFGGMGNSSGDQTVGRMYYYELYKINLEENKIDKVWEIPWNNENVVPVRNMVFDHDNTFYTLCYPEHFSHSFLRLHHFSVDDGTYEVLGDSIPILSEKITTNANLYYNAKANKLISIVQEFENDDVASTAKVYSIAFPPVTKARLTLYNAKPSQWTMIVIPALVALAVLLVLLLFYLKKKGNKPKIASLLKYTPPKVDSQAIPSRPNAIYLFGEFSMIDKNNREINYLLSAKLRQAFFFILHHSLEKGLSSQDLSEELWPSKSYGKSKNSRGVTINNLRKILGDLDGIHLVHEKGIYKITIDDECYCDYLRCLKIVLGENMDENMDEFVSIISRGKFLDSEDIQLYDSFKEYIERRIESAIHYYMEKAYGMNNFTTAISLCDSIFNLDPLDEKALQYLMRSLSKLELKEEAKRRYYLFTVEYKKSLGEEFNKSFADLYK